MKTAVEIELDAILSLEGGIAQDVEELERHWPSKRRGSRASKTINRLLDRVRVMIQCAADARKHLTDTQAPG